MKFNYVKILPILALFTCEPKEGIVLFSNINHSFNWSCSGICVTIHFKCSRQIMKSCKTHCHFLVKHYKME